MARTSFAPALLILLVLALGMAACGKKSDKGTNPDGGGTYARLAECDTMNWLGLPDSISCPKSGGLCPISGLGKVGTNVCRVGQSAYVYGLVVGVAFASEMRAELNGSTKLLSPANGYIVFDTLRERNELTIEVEYKDSLQAPAATVYTKNYAFFGVD